jgi:hypothetical protein
VLAVTQSPTPSTVRMAASWKGEQRKALAAWERWCSENKIRFLEIPSSASSFPEIQSLSIIQEVIELQKTLHECG